LRVFIAIEFGEAPQPLIEKIKKCIDETASNQNNFQLYFNKIGNFPRGNKSIIWIGLKEDDKLNTLYKNIENELEKVNIKKEERKFTPHITLGRQIVLNEDFNKLREEISVESLPILVDKISLMESTRINGELKYIPIYIKELK